MSKQQAIFDWLKSCPAFYDRLYYASAEENDGDNVVLPFGASERFKLDGAKAVDGLFYGDMLANDTYYEEYQVQCFRYINAEQNDLNILSFDDVQAVCDWVFEQNSERNFPLIENERVISVMPYPFLPQVAGRDVETGLWKLYFTLRITYVNKCKGWNVDEQRNC